MLLKKKTEIEVTLTEEELEIERLKAKVEMYKRRYESLVSDLHQQKLDDARFLKEEQQIADELEEDINKHGFDDQMGNPLEFLDKIFGEKDEAD